MKKSIILTALLLLFCILLLLSFNQYRMAASKINNYFSFSTRNYYSELEKSFALITNLMQVIDSSDTQGIATYLESLNNSMIRLSLIMESLSCYFDCENAGGLITGDFPASLLFEKYAEKVYEMERFVLSQPKLSKEQINELKNKLTLLKNDIVIFKSLNVNKNMSAKKINSILSLLAEKLKFLNE
ncbi:hypothetical protein [Caldicellulosiruptor morganii]|uniref:Uncharacterized protein n=1 Tax=Caldicellulosiruptor morganii TaxID=1387555 RepID=A0ABY7BM71_9FIRM|nr:hypothetical protein [Caldicellulosiruptor morganii]WAM33942.1 hypothetical protein OTK00_000083 [Caldicellulosiruptor morganii]